MGLKVGDIVARKSYGCDVLFKIVEIINSGSDKVITLKGIYYRIQADAPETDLIVQSDQYVKEHSYRNSISVDKKNREILSSAKRMPLKKAFLRDTPKEKNGKYAKPGRVLHLDGDKDYLDMCIKEYKKFGMDVEGKYAPEKEQASLVYKLLLEKRPDILVLTGHDGVKGKNYFQLNNYSNSGYFIDAVKEARRYESDLDGLVIFAGACQSMYTEIISAGANFASSPYRVLIHMFDPVFVCQKIAFTSIDRIIDPSDVINNTITGLKGVGGLQTRGKYRDGYPIEPDSKEF